MLVCGEHLCIRNSDIQTYIPVRVTFFNKIHFNFVYSKNVTVGEKFEFHENYNNIDSVNASEEMKRWMKEG